METLKQELKDAIKNGIPYSGNRLIVNEWKIIDMVFEKWQKQGSVVKST